MQTILRIPALVLLLFVHGQMQAQLTDQLSGFSHIASPRWLRIHYDNDFFTGSDHYYTQGITIEYGNKKLQDFPLYDALLNFKNGSRQSGISFNLFGYTPTRINSPVILYGDRPFAAGITMKFFSSSTNSKQNKRVSSAISAGVIGPAALGEEIQTHIHRWTGNKIPLGWQHQVRNDVVLNYQLLVERKLFHTRGITLSGLGELHGGTLYNRIGTGLHFMTGVYRDPYNPLPGKKFQLYLYGKAQVNLVGYDAMLQGGVLNRKSPYTIPARDINRITALVQAGVTVQTGKLIVRYSQGYITKEFYPGKDHRWGGLAATLLF